MIYLTQFEIEKRYGPSFATGGAKRFNAESCTRHTVNAFKYEFGYMVGHCVYAIVQKATGGGLSVVERESLLSLSGKGPWVIIDGKEAETNHPLALKYTPPKEEVNFPSPLFASHQSLRAQLVVWYPKWQVDLKNIEANPL